MAVTKVSGFRLTIDGEEVEAKSVQLPSLDPGPAEPIGINLTLAPNARKNMEKTMSRGKMKPMMTQDSGRSGRGPSISLPRQSFSGPMVAPRNTAIGPVAEPETSPQSRAARRRAAKLEKKP